jgi:pSer/pThr/pTyr-binding forkhead associated (FHA) protein
VPSLLKREKDMVRLASLAVRLLASSAARRGARSSADGRTVISIVVRNLAGGPPRRFPMKVVKLGRSKDADLTVGPHGNAVSRLHATLVREGNELRVKDLGSREGTFINDVRVKAPWLVEPDDVVRLGAKGPRFTCRLDAGTPAASSRPQFVVASAATSAGVLVVLLSMLASALRHPPAKEVATAPEAPAPRAPAEKKKEDVERLEKEVAALKARLETPASPGETTPAPSAVAGLAGRYDLTSTETSSPITLLVEENGRVLRSVRDPDGLWHSRVGSGVLAGTTLTVAFDRSIDPRDLSGEWTVVGSTPAGSYTATARFELARDGWSGGFDAGQRSVRMSGKLAGRSFSAVRRESGSQAQTEVTYALSENGLKLSAAWGQTTEAFTRKHVPADRLACAASYVFSGQSLTGTLDGGVKDTGGLHEARAAASAVTARNAAPTPAQAPAPAPAPRPDVAPDPVPTQLLTNRTTTVYRSPALDAPTLCKVEKYTRLTVTQRTNQFWEIETKDHAKAYVPVDDMAPLTRQYKEIKGPIFNDRPLASSVRQSDLGICYLIAALLGIAQENPGAIRDMIKDEGDGTVSVRFYHCDQQAGQSHFEENWVKVSKSVVVDDEDQPHYAIGEGGQAWGPLIVKAFAVWHGQGFYSRLSGGNQASVFRAILGRPAECRFFTPDLPFDFAPGLRERVLKDPKDREAVARFSGKESDMRYFSACLFNSNPEKVDADRTGAEAFIEKNAMGVSPAGRKALLAYYEQELGGLGPMGSGSYSKRALEFYQDIADALARRRPVGLDTRKWSIAGTGRSAGENTASVAGLAASHAYVVVGASEHDGLKWIKIQNPWGMFSRRYIHAGKTWTARGTNPDERFREAGDDGVFEVELSDVVRYFWSVDVGTR